MPSPSPSRVSAACWAAACVRWSAQVAALAGPGTRSALRRRARAAADCASSPSSESQRDSWSADGFLPLQPARSRTRELRPAPRRRMGGRRGRGYRRLPPAQAARLAASTAAFTRQPQAKAGVCKQASRRATGAGAAVSAKVRLWDALAFIMPTVRGGRVAISHRRAGRVRFRRRPRRPVRGRAARACAGRAPRAS